MKATDCIRKFRFGFFEKPLSNLCYKYALCVVAHPWPYIVIPLLISAGLGVGLGVDGTFTPARALSWDGECDLVVSAKDKGNILRPDYRKAVIKLNDFVMSEIAVTVNHTEYSYRNICLRFLQFCHTNPQIYVFNMMLSNPQPNNNLSYPMARIGNRRFYIANTLGDVEIDRYSREIVSAKAWQLVYHLDGYDKISKKWQLEYQRIMQAYKDDLLDITLGVSKDGCIHVWQGFEPSRLLPDDSYAKSYQKRLEQYFWAKGTQAHVTFSNAGDLTDKLNRDRIFAILDRFANSKHGMGTEGIDCWLYEFRNFLKNYNKQSLDSLESDKFLRTVKFFLSLEEYAQYRNDVHWTNTSSELNITAFRALVGMIDFETALKQIETVDSFRAIASEYPYYNISTFENF